jgi:hypothetical protein
MTDNHSEVRVPAIEGRTTKPALRRESEPIARALATAVIAVTMSGCPMSDHYYVSDSGATGTVSTGAAAGTGNCALGHSCTAGTVGTALQGSIALQGGTASSNLPGSGGSTLVSYGGAQPGSAGTSPSAGGIASITDQSPPSSGGATDSSPETSLGFGGTVNASDQTTPSSGGTTEGAGGNSPSYGGIANSSSETALPSGGTFIGSEWTSPSSGGRGANTSPTDAGAGGTRPPGGGGNGAWSGAPSGGGTGGSEAAGSGNTEAACAGVSLSGICWYLGKQGASCNEVCTPHGGFASGATSWVGTLSQGGSLSKCQTLFNALGINALVESGARMAGEGMGCYLFGFAQNGWWLSSPNFASNASQQSARIVCGCLQ